MRKVKWFIPLILVGLIAAVFSMGFALPPEEGKRNGWVGEVLGEAAGYSTQVEADGSGVMVLKTLKGEKLVIKLPVGDDGYKLKTPGRPDGTLASEALGPGARVAVLAQWTDGAWVAKQVLVKPEKPILPAIGAVVEIDVEGRTVTVTTKSGKQHTFILPDDIELPEVGELVSVFRDPDASSDEKSGMAPVIAKGLVKASRIRERLRKHLAEVTSEDGDVEGKASQVKARLAERLTKLMEKQSDRHVRILDQIKERVPDRVKQAISQAKGRVLADQDKMDEALEKARSIIDRLKQWRASNTRTPGTSGAAP